MRGELLNFWEERLERVAVGVFSRLSCFCNTPVPYSPGDADADDIFPRDAITDN